MRVYDLIAKKRDGKALSAEEVRFLVEGYSAGAIPDYQMAAFLMAVYLRGMTDEETTAMALAMADSGERLALGGPGEVFVDKHSTGGVGDKTTLVLVPLAAECGLRVAKMSGRGLGHAGGTIDKLESIPGLRTDLSIGEMLGQVREVGAAIVGQSADLTPADKKIYALRDVTATVESVPLIAASVMSKKIALGAGAFVLDVKAGRAAYMKTEADAVRLAEAMAAIARLAGRRAIAWVTAMDQPLGQAVGNAIEVREAVLTLKGLGPPDLVDLVVALGAEMLRLGGIESDAEKAKERVRSVLASGRALGRFKALVEAQGGDPDYLDRVASGGEAPDGYAAVPVPAPKGGWVTGIDGGVVGRAAMALGAGRERPGQAIDHGVGVYLYKKTGDRVQAGEPVALAIAPDRARGEEAVARIASAYEIGASPVPRPPLLLARIDSG